MTTNDNKPLTEQAITDWLTEARSAPEDRGLYVVHDEIAEAERLLRIGLAAQVECERLTKLRDSDWRPGCAYCGWIGRWERTIEASDAREAEHARSCEKHPLFQALAEAARLRTSQNERAIAELVSAQCGFIRSVHRNDAARQDWNTAIDECHDQISKRIAALRAEQPAAPPTEPNPAADLTGELFDVAMKERQERLALAKQLAEAQAERDSRCEQVDKQQQWLDSIAVACGSLGLQWSELPAHIKGLRESALSSSEERRDTRRRIESAEKDRDNWFGKAGAESTRADRLADELAKLRETREQRVDMHKDRIEALAKELDAARAERDSHRKLLEDTLSILPVGNLRTHTIDTVPDRVQAFADSLAEMREESVDAARAEHRASLERLRTGTNKALTANVEETPRRTITDGRICAYAATLREIDVELAKLQPAPAAVSTTTWDLFMHNHAVGLAPARIWLKNKADGREIHYTRDPVTPSTDTPSVICKCGAVHYISFHCKIRDGKFTVTCSQCGNALVVSEGFPPPTVTPPTGQDFNFEGVRWVPAPGQKQEDVERAFQHLTEFFEGRCTMHPVTPPADAPNDPTKNVCAIRRRSDGYWWECSGEHGAGWNDKRIRQAWTHRAACAEVERMKASGVRDDVEVVELAPKPRGEEDPNRVAALAPADAPARPSVETLRRELRNIDHDFVNGVADINAVDRLQRAVRLLLDDAIAARTAGGGK